MEKETESDPAKSNFLARMNHEMRTPLNAIIGMATIAQSSDEIEKIKICLDKINEASTYLLGMINDILDLAKIEDGNLKLTCAKFDLIRMLQRTVDSKKFSLDAKKQNLILDFDPALPETIVGDEQRLVQVLDNFLSNAIKFTSPEGTITLSVKKLKEDENTCVLSISVSDTGIGISEEGLKKIFALFEQLDGSLARRYGGAGMGLTISENIVRLMGGEIRVTSQPGSGSCFAFDFAVETGRKKAADSSATDGKNDIGSAQKPKQKPKQEPRFEGISILLAEDVEINREIVISLLEDSGLSIDCAENGLEALEKYKAAPSKYSLILMDIHMPEMDGLEATRQIRAFEKELKEKMEFIKKTAMKSPKKTSKLLLAHTEGVPIIAMTANVYKDDVQKCLEAGMTTHLGKPIDFGELMRQLEKYLTCR